MNEIQSRPRYIPEFDGLRGLSILMVMAYHCFTYQGNSQLGQTLADITSVGWCGVDVFFVLSGFLITGILLDTRGTERYFRNFFIRRGLRIFPLYYAVLFAILADYWLLKLWGIGIQDKSLLFIDYIWVNFLYLSNFSSAIYGPESVPVNIAWSLAIEEQFYLVYPAIVLWFDRKNLAKFLIVCVALAPIFRALTWWLGPQPQVGPYAMPYCRIDALAIGALTQIALRAGHHEACRRFARWAPAFVLVALAFLFTWRREDWPFAFFGYSFVALAASVVVMRVMTSTEKDWLHYAFGNRAIIYIGRLSYGLYLLHLMARAIFDRFAMPRWPTDALHHLEYSTLRFFGISIIAMIIATLSFYLFEMPILRLKDRWAPTKKRTFENPAPFETVVPAATS